MRRRAARIAKRVTTRASKTHTSGAMRMVRTPTAAASRLSPIASSIRHQFVIVGLVAGVLTAILEYHQQIAAPPSGTAAIPEAIDTGHMSVLAAATLADLSAPDSMGKTPLMRAARLGREPAVELLLSRGVDVNASDERTGTALMAAAAYGGSPAIVLLLLRHGADVHFMTETGDDALTSAVLNGNAECARILLDAGANPKASRRHVPLLALVAATGDRADLTRILLDAGAEPDGAERNGVVPLVAMAEEGAASCFEMLLKAGANPDLADLGGRTARSVATKRRQEKILRLLAAQTR